MIDPFGPLPADDEGEEELWLVSYADLLTLLIAFFVVLATAAPVKAATLEAMAATLSGSSGAPLSKLKDKVDRLIADGALTESVRTHEDAQGLGIELREAVLFPSGSAELHPQARALIGRMAALLGELPGRRIIVEGHTDELPIHTAAFQSNWQLGAERAVQVVRALERSGIPHARLSVASYADTRPAPVGAQTSLDQRRAASRRVVIRVE